MNAYYTIVIVAALVGFLILAALLLVPVYRFLKREEQASEQWTHESLHRHAQAREHPPENGAVRDTRPEE